MTAATLDEAIELQNAVDYGLTAGIHSLDADEVARWLDPGRGGQPLRQPADHGRDRAPSAVRRLEALDRRTERQGGRTEHSARARLLASGAPPSRRATSRLDGLDPRVVGAHRGLRAGPRLPRVRRACAAARSATPPPGRPSTGSRATCRRSASSATCSATGTTPVTCGSPRAATSPTWCACSRRACVAHAPIRVSSATPLPSGAAAAHRGRPRARCGSRTIAIENDAEFAAWAVAREAGPHPAHRRRRSSALRRARRSSGCRDLLRRRHDRGPHRAAAVPARAGGLDHGAPLRQPRPVVHEAARLSACPPPSATEVVERYPISGSARDYG